MSDTEDQLRAQLMAAQETIKALSRRMHQLEDGDAHLPLQKQLQSYQQSIEEKTAALHEVTNWFELTVQHSMDAIIRVDQQGVVQSWNPMAEQMFGYRETEALGELVESILIPARLHDDDPGNFYRHLKRGKGELLNRRIEARAQCKDGSELPVEFVGSVVRQKDTLTFIIVLRDISERKSAEQALSDSHANLEMLVERRTREVRDLATIIEVTVNFVGMIDVHGNIFYLNPAGRKMVGIDKDAALDEQKFEDFHSRDTCQRLARDIYPKTLEQGVLEIECDFIDRSGNVIPTACILMSLPDEQDRPDRLAVIARDLRDEMALQRRVEHSQRLESLGVLAGGIAHDFNNILTAILGNAALAELKLDQPQEMPKYLNNIVESSEKAAALCKQMLAYSGKGKFIVKPENISDMVSEITKLLKVSITKNIVITLNLNKQLPLVDGDKSQLQQVIMNLVINASDAIGTNDGMISITTDVMTPDRSYLKTSFVQDSLPEGRYVFLEVSDNGSGMDEKTQRRIFDPFFSTKFTGRGLGLSAVLGIIRGHHGALKVDSKPGYGTTFRMLLPISSSPAQEEDMAPVDNNACHGFGTILIIDDEAAIREIASMALENAGFKTLTAVDGIDGMEIYRAHHDKIAAVLLDMTMPRMDGQACFQELHRINSDVAVVLSSGYNEQDAISSFTHTDLAGFIQKPYRPDALKAVIHAAINRKNGS